MAKTDFSKINKELQKAAERKANQEAGKGNKKFEKIVWGKIPFGDTSLMVLPPFSDDSELFHECYIHHNFEDNDGNKRSYLCSKSLHGSCPICDHVEHLKKQGDTKTASSLRGQRTFLYNGMDSEGNVKVYPMKPSQHTEVLQEINTNHIDNDLDITDPNNGKLIKISRLKQAPWARARVLGKKMELSANKVDEVLSKLRDLTKVYINNTPEELLKMLNGEPINVFLKKEKATTESTESEEESDDSEVDSPAIVEVMKREEKQEVPVKAKRVTKTTETVVETPKVTTTAKSESTGDAELDNMLSDLGLD